MKQGAYDYLTKRSRSRRSMRDRRALENGALVEDNLALPISWRPCAVAQLLGKSRAMHKVFEMITKIHSVKTAC